MFEKEKLVRTIRRTQTIISVISFFVIFLFFWEATEFKLTEIQLSQYGAAPTTNNWLWNSIIAVLGVSTFLNSFFFIKKHGRMKNKIIPHISFGFVSLCLILVGVFSVEYRAIHNVAAYLYFFAYPLAIFVMAYLNRESLLYKEWMVHIIISIAMITIPLAFINFFNGMAISELAHIVIVVVWNIRAAFKH
jgi:hypothetical membrane protein